MEGYSAVKYGEDKIYYGNDPTHMQELVERMRAASFKNEMHVHLYVCWGAKQPDKNNSHVKFPLAQYLANALPAGAKVTSSLGRYAFDEVVNLALGKQYLTASEELTFTHRARQTP